ncbi:MAG: hypothetical protein R2749_03390 [Acidimicrobiales bacterium]
MNRALLAELQHRRCYPSVTILLPTRPGSVLTAEDRDHARRLLEATDLRLSGDVTEDIRTVVVQQLEALIEQRSIQPAAQALALCASRSSPPRCRSAVRWRRGSWWTTRSPPVISSPTSTARPCTGW